MSEVLSGIGEEEDLRRISGSFTLPDSQIHARDRQDGDAILRTQNCVGNISSLIPSSSDRSLKGRVTLGEPISASTENVDASPIDETPLNEMLSQLDSYKKSLEEIESKEVTDLTKIAEFPNLVQEALSAGLAKEAQSTAALQGHLKEAEKHQKDIDLLLDLSAEMTALKGDSAEITEKMKSILQELKEREIDLWKKEGSILSKEDIAELKSLSSAQVDKIRSNLQILFTTKIQTLIQSIGSIMETLKEIIRNNTQLLRTINRLPGH